MRLINVRSLELREFIGRNIPEYAILSHTWEDGEVSFQDMLNVHGAHKKPGFKKVLFCCQQASTDGWEWAWVDTCCIDKTSSAELSEAINSMYRWYSQAMVCYAYLSDINSHQEFTNPGPDGIRWFERGWTLQELIAPFKVCFYTSDWQYIGTKKEFGTLISTWTGIDSRILDHSISIKSASVALRMSWAAERRTTRDEDVAYCLLGIFDVNMPLLYGEGGLKAFERLQENIARLSDDHTLFLWGCGWGDRIDYAKGGRDDQISFGSLYRNMLADTPADFYNSNRWRCIASNRLHEMSIAAEHRGIKISLRMKELSDAERRRLLGGVVVGLSVYAAALDCLEILQDTSPADSHRGLNIEDTGIAPFQLQEDSIERVAIFLVRLTPPESKTNTPVFTRLRAYTTVPHQELVGWEFTTCFISRIRSRQQMLDTDLKCRTSYTQFAVRPRTIESSHHGILLRIDLPTPPNLIAFLFSYGEIRAIFLGMKLKPGFIKTELRLVSETISLRELCTEAEEKEGTNKVLLEEKLCEGYGPVFEKTWIVGGYVEISLILKVERDSLYDRYVPWLMFKSHSAMLSQASLMERALDHTYHTALNF